MQVTSRTSVGSLLALVSSVVFALNVSCVPLIYDGGGNIHAINLVRPLAFLAFVGLWIMVGRGTLRLPSTQMAGAVLIGGLLCILFYALNAAVAFIPVGLAVLVMYIYPMLVAFASALLGRGRLSWPVLAVLVVIFAGLALALSAPVAALEWRGVALAVGASFTMCVMILLGEATMDGHDSKTVMFYAMISASVIMLALLASGVPFVFPSTSEGVTAMVAATSAYVIATSLLFVTVTMIGPLHFAVIDNTAPVWATLIGIFLVGENAGLIQWIGMIMVVAGVTAVQFLQAPAHRQASPEIVRRDPAWQ
jgi:drug/metabolite transporter (DMT)-like permease